LITCIPNVFALVRIRAGLEQSTNDLHVFRVHRHREHVRSATREVICTRSTHRGATAVRRSDRGVACVTRRECKKHGGVTGIPTAATLVRRLVVAAVGYNPENV
jgi:hypothetical protein